MWSLVKRKHIVLKSADEPVPLSVRSSRIGSFSLILPEFLLLQSSIPVDVFYLAEKQFLRVMPDVCPSKLMVVYPPCDVDSMSIGNKPIGRKQRPSNQRYTFLSMNRFWPEKRIDIIVEAAGVLLNSCIVS